MTVRFLTMCGKRDTFLCSSKLKLILSYREFEAGHPDSAGRPGPGEPDEVAGADVGGEERSAHLRDLNVMSTTSTEKATRTRESRNLGQRGNHAIWVATCVALTGMNDMLLEERKYPSTESLLLFHEEKRPTASTKPK